MLTYRHSGYHLCAYLPTRGSALMHYVYVHSTCALLESLISNSQPHLCLSPPPNDVQSAFAAFSSLVK